MSALEGKAVTTIEGIATPGRPADSPRAATLSSASTGRRIRENPIAAQLRP